MANEEALLRQILTLVQRLSGDTGQVMTQQTSAAATQATLATAVTQLTALVATLAAGTDTQQDMLFELRALRQTVQLLAAQIADDVAVDLGDVGDLEN